MNYIVYDFKIPKIDNVIPSSTSDVEDKYIYKNINYDNSNRIYQLNAVIGSADFTSTLYTNPKLYNSHEFKVDEDLYKYMSQVCLNIIGYLVIVSYFL